MIKFKDFEKWTYEQATSGEWSYNIALFCFRTCRKIKMLPFWRRGKMWKAINELYDIAEIIKDANMLTNRRTFVMK